MDKMKRKQTDTDSLKKEIELLKREIDLLKREVEYLKMAQNPLKQWEWIKPAPYYDTDDQPKFICRVN